MSWAYLDHRGSERVWRNFDAASSAALEAAFAEVRGSGGVLAPHFAEVHPTSLDMVDPEDVRETRRRAAARCGSDEGDAEVEAVGDSAADESRGGGSEIESVADDGVVSGL